ncbi:MAG: cation:proton antiporter [Pirellulaceae bacterium]|nr:cation:proton antiporter [Pirellulaceae bacterium]
MNLQPSAIASNILLLFLQIAVILAACRLVGKLAKYIGQPAVVGEMIAGILLGPSLFELLWPKMHDQIFPVDSMPILYAISQFGLILYMFILGLDFEAKQAQQRLKTVISVSVVGMLAPFLLGAMLANWLYACDGFYSEQTQLYEAMLFTGIATCITAFPMLARIIVENRLVGTPLATIVLAAGAINDIAAWILLALFLSINDGHYHLLVLAIGGGVLFVFFSLRILKPMLGRLVPLAEKKGFVTSSQLVLVLGIVTFGSFCADAIGIHSVFGAFIIGCAMPRGIVSQSVKRQIEPLTLSLLVPLFFAYSGLNTRIDLVCTPWLLWVTLLAFIAACAGKIFGGWAAARWAGETHGTSMAIGCLMNARGMMGLIILIIGKENGIISAELFSILVLVAVLTTLATTPTFRWIQARYL